MAEKTAIEDSANATRKKMQMAQQLIDGLSENDNVGVRMPRNLRTRKSASRRLCARKCISVYCGVFDQTFRETS